MNWRVGVTLGDLGSHIDLGYLQSLDSKGCVLRLKYGVLHLATSMIHTVKGAYCNRQPKTLLVPLDRLLFQRALPVPEPERFQPVYGAQARWRCVAHSGLEPLKHVSCMFSMESVRSVVAHLHLGYFPGYQGFLLPHPYISTSPELPACCNGVKHFQFVAVFQPGHST